MGRRSVYHGLACFHCGDRIKDGRAAIVSTYYVHPRHDEENKGWVSAYSRLRFLAKHGVEMTELEVRIAYHRRCVERILAKAPLEPEEEAKRFDSYRDNLLERYGLADAADL